MERPAVEQRAHAFARERGVSPRLYACARALTSVILRLWFRVKVSGREHIPSDGPAILAPNHKNFLDPFFIGIAARRHVRYMAKVELFNRPLGWLFVRLGAFPVRRGRADVGAIDTARAILSAGGVVVVFPEGTRVEAPDALGIPHHGAGRLAGQTGAPIVPAAITGTSHLWRGALPQLKRVQLTFLPAVEPGFTAEADDVSRLIDERVWPSVREEYGRLRARPGALAALLAGLGLGGGVLARQRLKATRPIRLLGTVESRKLRHHEARRRRLKSLKLRR
jgi:1-acyl-sn-glycerol-3-phosphate acyltransferase